jgi:multisubunit Na+/H+ antiporter MnhG subunit
MTAHGVVTHVLVWSAVATELVCVLGVALGRDAFARLHYASAAATLGPILVAVALVVEEGVHSTATAAAAGVAFLLLMANPITTIATARAAKAQE